ncbi:MAG: tRNA (N6-threonylcarbamoyladenosine(37)-N6)-methyltransferase TrmO [Bacteroidales bacterium]|nr:tRNA (N6-threonylcarbamoyladenosine(37)-N6)-methyltransferase TrmO [Bacteroidales bacterium]
MHIEPIAYFRSPLKEKFGIPRQSGVVPDLKGRIEFTPAYRDREALRGMEGYDYLWVIWGFSENVQGEPAPADKTAFRATVRPPRLGGNRRVGVFASRSPFRPNSLGLSSIKISGIAETAEGPVIEVSGGDLMDGTPIYDIKPYVPYCDSHPGARAGFTDSEEWKPLEVSFSEKALECLVKAFRNNAEREREIISALIAQDPRPHYQDDPEKTYGMSYGPCQVRFRVTEGRAEITGIES